MRILYFSRDCTPHDHRFLSALAKTAHKVYFLRLEKGPHMFEERPLPPEIQPVEWKGGKRPLGLISQLGLVADLRRVIREVKPDLVQAGPIQRSAFLTALAGFKHLVSVSWGYDLLHDARINPLWRWATRFTLRRSAALVGDCNTIRLLATTYGMPGARIVTFPWGVDINHFNVDTFKGLKVGTFQNNEIGPSETLSQPILPKSSAQTVNYSPSTPTKGFLNVQTSERSNVTTFRLLSTRHFEPIYGVDVIAHAFVIAAHQNPALRLTLLSTGSQESRIRQIFLVGNVFDRVEFIGKVGYDDLPRYYQGADVYLSASHSDGSSISLLEAFACGTPAIVADIPGNREWVTPGENGWLFPDGDATALAGVILKAAQQPEQLESMGRRARMTAEQRADWTRNFPLLENAYAIAMGSSTDGIPTFSEANDA
jgi:glycosyltransferase involved in cell wall biosynthesis